MMFGWNKVEINETQKSDHSYASFTAL